MPPSYLNMKSSGLTPGDLFTKKHKNLQREGEKWMKDTAKYDRGNIDYNCGFRSSFHCTRW